MDPAVVEEVEAVPARAARSDLHEPWPDPGDRGLDGDAVRPLEPGQQEVVALERTPLVGDRGPQLPDEPSQGLRRIACENRPMIHQ